MEDKRLDSTVQYKLLTVYSTATPTCTVYRRYTQGIIHKVHNKQYRGLYVFNMQNNMQHFVQYARLYLIYILYNTVYNIQDNVQHCKIYKAIFNIQDKNYKILHLIYYYTTITIFIIQ